MTSERGRERELEAWDARGLNRNDRSRREEELPAGGFAEPRSWAARAKDEIASWFGDTGAMRRRQWDEAAGDHTGKGPAREVDDDIRIVDELNHRLTADRLLDASGVTAICEAGVVTLDGHVPTSASAQRAEGLASAVPGVKRVANHLVVS
ncbi:MAG TPA: BON domain-containing protein [Caulobacteraceae bacterium]|jgi:osmotically-inducible protein OsmY|nr:BON domain-containing protein [Caulobacteraceae bacterium]